MKNLKQIIKGSSKIIIPSLIVLSSLLISNTSKAQEFLPGKLKDYQTKSDTIYYPKFIQSNKEGDFYLAKFYDIEKDGIEDVIELYLVEKVRDKDSLFLKIKENPILYLFQIEKDAIMVVDPAQNGLQKEDFYNRKEDYEIGKEKPLFI